jgi:hypothetical protein
MQHKWSLTLAAAQQQVSSTVDHFVAYLLMVHVTAVMWGL